MHRLLLAALVVLALFGQEKVASNKASAPLPTFEDYRVPTPIPKRWSDAILARPGPDESGAQFQRRIREAAKEGPDVAGTYAVVQISCGSNCVNIWIVGAKTGAILETPFIGATQCVPFSDGPLLSYRLNSRLLIVTGSLEIPDSEWSFKDGPCGTFYYVVERRRLRLIRALVPLQ